MSVNSSYQYNNLAIVYARTSSSRLPGKVLFSLGDDTIIGHCIRKLIRLSMVKVVIATSVSQEDDAIEEWANTNNIDVYRGDLVNVADRTKGCLLTYPSNRFLRINADSPFIQPDLITEACTCFERDSSIDLVSNVSLRTYPYGIAVEMMRSELFLEHLVQFDEYECEHISTYFYRRHDKFRIKTLRNDYDASGERFVLDTQEDWKFLQDFYKFDNRIFEYNLKRLLDVKKQFIELKSI